MRQAIATILGTTIMAWGLAAAPAFAETATKAYGPCKAMDSRIECLTARAAHCAELRPQPTCPDETGPSAAAERQAATVPASDHLLALLHRLNRIDGSPMAPFRLN